MPLENFSVIWSGASVYNGNLQGPVTLAPITDRLGVELAVTTCYDLGLSRLGFEHQTLRGERSNPLRHRRFQSLVVN